MYGPWLKYNYNNFDWCCDMPGIFQTNWEDAQIYDPQGDICCRKDDAMDAYSFDEWPSLFQKVKFGSCKSYIEYYISSI